ncbi:MAG: GerAB/ArcD/ProY family transporter, partial [Lachnospiraceae bacterium]|nr:GerAB/ArcD/ProY family transporter [Lachnospiraceae bacterium]
MFASNGKISVRQIKRLMIFNLFGISSLILPEILAATSGIDGSLAILLGMVLAFLFLGLLNACIGQMDGDYYAYLREAFGKWLAGVCQIFYFLYYVCISGFSAYTICHLVVKNLLQEESFLLVLILLLFIGAYGIYGGLECRARVYEILFWGLAILLLIMLALSVGTVDIDKWMPFLYDSRSDFCKSTYLVFGLFSWIFFVLFLKPFCTEKAKLAQSMRKVVLTTGCLLFFMYLILTGIFGSKALAETPYSVVVLMSMVELPGGFLERFDAVMVAIWFFALYALMDHTIFHSVDIFMRTFSVKKKRYSALFILILVGIVAQRCWDSLYFLHF